jgi:hypothetical protein
VEVGKSVGFHVSSTVMTGFQWIVHWWVLTTHYSPSVFFTRETLPKKRKLKLKIRKTREF